MLELSHDSIASPLQQRGPGGRAQDDDLISLYVFGEDEDDLTDEAERNGGVVQYARVRHHHHADIPLTRAKSLSDVSHDLAVSNPHYMLFYHSGQNTRSFR